MKKLLTFVLLLSSYSALHAQILDWAGSFGGFPQEAPFSVAVDPSGNSYSVGVFAGTIDFDPGPGIANLASPGVTGTFILKLDAAGNFVWVKAIHGGSKSIALDNSGNIIICGYFGGWADFDPGPGVHNEYAGIIGTNMYILKLDVDGNFIWVRNMGGESGADHLYRAEADDAGNIYATGGFQGTVDFDPGSGVANLTGLGEYDVVVLKYDASGNYLWAKNMSGTRTEHGRYLALDATGNVYITGYFEGTVDFDPGAGIDNLTAPGIPVNMFVAKLDATGNHLWARNIGSIQTEAGYSCETDAAGNLYITGTYQDSVDFDPGPGTAFLSALNGGSNAFVLKLNTAGQYVWAKSIGNNGADAGIAITVDSIGNSYSTGAFYGTVDFDPNSGVYSLTSMGSSEGFILKLDSTGKFGWAMRLGGTGEDFINAVVLRNDKLYMAGVFSDIVDFDPNSALFPLTSNGQKDAFILKLSPPCPVTAEATAAPIVCKGANAIVSITATGGVAPYTGIGVYPKPAGTYDFFVTDAKGCTDVVTITLAEGPDMNVNVAVAGGTLTVDQTGAGYQWVDCNKNYAFIQGANSQSYTPKANGSYAVIVFKDPCIDTSDCITVTGLSIKEADILDKIAVVPNPNDGHFNINTPVTVNVRVTNILGQVLYSRQINSGTTPIQMDRPASGMYFVTIQSRYGDRAYPIIIK